MKLEANEIKILGEYKFVGDEFLRSQKNRNENEYLLCLRETYSGYEIDRVRKEDASIWEIFKSYFGCGKLAGCDLSFDAIVDYLGKRDISEVAADTPAYDAIHAIAARALIYRKPNQELWKKLSTGLKSFTVEHVHREWSFHQLREREWEKKSVHRTLLITPKTCIGHLIAQVDDLENRSWDRWIGPKPTEAKKWASWGEGHKPIYHTLTRSALADEKNIKDLFFKIVDSVTYRYMVYNDPWMQTWRHPTWLPQPMPFKHETSYTYSTL